jgi:hypothetical protein
VNLSKKGIVKPHARTRDRNEAAAYPLIPPPQPPSGPRAIRGGGGEEDDEYNAGGGGGGAGGGGGGGGQFRQRIQLDDDDVKDAVLKAIAVLKHKDINATIPVITKQVNSDTYEKTEAWVVEAALKSLLRDNKLAYDDFGEYYEIL